MRSLVSNTTETKATGLQFGRSIAFRAFVLMLVLVTVLFGTVFMTMQTQARATATQQNLKALATTGQESFFILAEQFQKKTLQDIAKHNLLPGSRGKFGWAWVRSQANRMPEIIASSGSPPCRQVLEMGDSYRPHHFTIDKPTANACQDTVVVSRHPTFLQDGQTRLSAVAWLDDKTAGDEIVQDFSQEFGAMFMIGLLLAILGSRALSTSLSKPITYLAKIAQHVANGDYSQRLSMNREDEIGQLANAFNRMAEAVNDREIQVRRLAYRDDLTGLFNRIFFLQTLQERMLHCNERLYIVTWDIDRFKVINEVLGFAVGDAVLSALGKRFEDELQDSLVTARLGGNAFAMVVPEGLGVQIEGLVKTVTQIVESPVIIDGQALDLTATIGISIHPEHGTVGNDLLRRAEIARFLAKRSHLRWLEYRTHFDVSSPARLTMLSELKTAIETPGQLQLFLQPKLSVATGRIDEAEALVRWNHPSRGMIPPSEFIPFAEQTGRISDLTNWAIGEALELISATRQHWPLRISVNVSAQDLEQKNFADNIIQKWRKANVPAEYLCLEITESAAMDDPECAMSTLHTLSKMGFHLAIDDFGTGYSSLSYLKRFPVNELKIDRSLVAGVQAGSDGETILRSTVELGHNMGLSVTAEGVETEDELNFLCKIGVDHIQGYLIARPMPLKDYHSFMAQFKPRRLYA
ncbi:MAG: EAL domain-containing protein [Burkholderiaceae bacterium]